MGDSIGKQKKEIYSYVDSSKENIYFGSYPQTEIKDETLIMELNKKAGTLPTKENTYNWIDYGYYIRGKIKSYMYYIDIELDGNKYRGVYFTQYRPYFTIANVCIYQKDNGYNTNTTYWFKYEPIEWNILTAKNNKVLIISDLILDSQDYYYSRLSRSVATDYQGNTENGTIYINNYMYSHIRSWLNITFYETAFSTLEKEIIETTEVDNSASSTGHSSNKYSCSNTRDKMFLLSYREAKKYFSKTHYSKIHYLLDSGRLAKVSNYANCQGFFDTFFYSYWLRSPDYKSYYGCGACKVYNEMFHFDGYSAGFSACYVYHTSIGVRPACVVNLK